MAKNYFRAYDFDDLTRVNQEIINWFKAKQYEVSSKLLQQSYFIQAKKTGKIRTLFGANLAFQIKIYWSDDCGVIREFIIETSIGKWVTNIAGAGFTSIFMGGIPFFTGLANAGWALILEKDLISYLENHLKLQKIYSIDSGYQTTENSSSYASQKADFKVKEEFEQLLLAFKQGVISKQEFETKKEILDEQKAECEAEFLIEEKIAKLQKAFEDGILDTFEYEEKIKQIHDEVKAEVFDKRNKQKKEQKMAKLKEALENGVLTEQEYRQKIAAL